MDGDDFSAYIGSIVSDGLICMSIALGIETGLFDVLISLSQPKTCQEIADEVKCKERYVKAWLGEMVSTGIVSLDSSKETFWVPEDHKPMLQRDGKHSKPVLTTLSVPVLSKAFHDIKECFELDGPMGVPPAKYSKFDRYLSNKNSIWFNHFLMQSFMPSVPGLVEKLEAGICVLDFCCGEGMATIAMARRFSKSQFFAFDLCETAVQTGQLAAEGAKLRNAHIVCHSAFHLPAEWTGKFQYVFCRSGIHDLPLPRIGLAELKRVLADDGVMSILEPDCHSTPAANLDLAYASSLYAFSLMNCLPVSLSFDGSEGLGAAWGREAARAMLEECGFKVMSITKVQEDIDVHLYCQKKEAVEQKLNNEVSIPQNSHRKDVGREQDPSFRTFIIKKGKAGLVSLALAIGLDLGLFDVMISLGQPKSCQEIADAGKFKERYVREWLRAMAICKIISMDTSGELYWIPAHHAPILQRGSKLSSPAMAAVSIPVLSEVFYALVDCFKLDGPKDVSSDKYSHCRKYIPTENSAWSVYLSRTD